MSLTSCLETFEISGPSDLHQMRQEMKGNSLSEEWVIGSWMSTRWPSGLRPFQVVHFFAVKLGKVAGLSNFVNYGREDSPYARRASY